MTPDNRKVAVFGGNGFVGVHVLERLAGKGIDCICISRTGEVPVHLRKSEPSWVDTVDWVKGDASRPDVSLLGQAGVVITLVGSPPVPTFTKEAKKQQVFMNGDTNVGAIEGAALAGVKRVVLLGAYMPKLLQTSRFGYYVGKQKAFEAARQFALLSAEHSAVVLRPTAIYGTRYTAKGRPIALDPLMGPVAKIQLSLPRFVRNRLPKTLVSVDQVATVLANAAISPPQNNEPFTIIENEQILTGHH
jgi:nucleoside-diphosphate-sugar epimerase